jgi:hypothetical protein
MEKIRNQDKPPGSNTSGFLRFFNIAAANVWCFILFYLPSLCRSFRTKTAQGVSWTICSSPYSDPFYPVKLVRAQNVPACFQTETFRAR